MLSKISHGFFIVIIVVTRQFGPRVALPITVNLRFRTTIILTKSLLGEPRESCELRAMEMDDESHAVRHGRGFCYSILFAVVLAVMGP